MKREEQDKLKKLFKDVQEISERIENFKIMGEVKDVVKCGNSSHIPMACCNKGKKALVILIPKFEKI